MAARIQPARRHLRVFTAQNERIVATIPVASSHSSLGFVNLFRELASWPELADIQSRKKRSVNCPLRGIERNF
jgi:hypothetical protein